MCDPVHTDKNSSNGRQPAIQCADAKLTVGYTQRILEQDREFGGKTNILAIPARLV
jgi:hypothetical protein